MALSFTLVDTWDDGQRIHSAGTVSASGSYTSGGDALPALVGNRLCNAGAIRLVPSLAQSKNAK